MHGRRNDLVDPYEPCAWLSGPEIPRLLFNPAVPGAEQGSAISGGSRGALVVSHYEDIDRVYTDNEFFSNKGTAEFQAMIGETFRSIPIAIDPPEHSKCRLFLMPHFSPKRLNQMQDQIRGVAVEMIESFASKGEVDVAWDFGRVFPVRIFMGLMGFPPAMFEQFLEWEWSILHGESREKTAGALRSVLDFLHGRLLIGRDASCHEGIDAGLRVCTGPAHLSPVRTRLWSTGSPRRPIGAGRCGLPAAQPGRISASKPPGATSVFRSDLSRPFAGRGARSPAPHCSSAAMRGTWKRTSSAAVA